MKKLSLITLLFIASIGHAESPREKARVLSQATKSSCSSRQLLICGAGDTNPVCQLVKGDAVETQASLETFFSKLEKLYEHEEMDAGDRQTRDDLVCARLFGSKQFKQITFTPIWKTSVPNVQTKLLRIFDLSERNQWAISEGSDFVGEYFIQGGLSESDFDKWKTVWDVSFQGDVFKRIGDNQTRLRALKRGSGVFSASFEGFVDRVEFIYVKTYSSGRVYNPGFIEGIKIVVHGARLTWLKTSAGEGTPEEVLRQSSEALKKAYDEFMR